MSKYRRARIPGASYFFTVATFDRRPLLVDDLARRCLRAAWTEVRRRYPFRTEAVCLLPDHLHCIWTLPQGDDDFSGRWRMLKGLFSKCYLTEGGSDGQRNRSRMRTGEAALWQRRFWEHAIADEVDMQRHMDYIHFNPVKHGYVAQPAQWPWSSLHRYVHKGWYDKHWGEQVPVTLQNSIDIGE